MDFWLERAQAGIQNAVQGMSAQQLAWHPDGKWCTAQILEHLSLAFAGTAKGMNRALGGETVTARRTWKDRLRAFVVVDCGYMPSGRQAPKGTVPGVGDPTGAIAIILANLANMDQALLEVERQKGRNVRLQHPVLGPLTIPQWRKFHWVHTHHHLKQIARLRSMQGEVRHAANQ